MLSRTGTFPAAYEAEEVDAPPAGDADYTFTDGRGGAQALTVSVMPVSGQAQWVGVFTVAEPSVTAAASGLFSTPRPTALCVVHRGVAFLVDVLHPAACQTVSTHGPVVAVEEAVDTSLLLLVTPWSITALDATAPLWTSPRIAIDGFRVEKVQGGWLRGIADPNDEEPRDFALNLTTGHLVGGAGWT